MRPWLEIGKGRAGGALIVADHASDVVPPGIALGIDAALLHTHIAIDIGVAALAEALCVRLACAAILGNVSRLVVDFNREEDAPHIIPTASDGHAIPGNAVSHDERLARIERYWRPYHDHVAARIAEWRPALLVSLHSFTPQLETKPGEARPWQIGVLYNEDDRAARVALPLLEAAGVIAGDQQPYSGKLLNATMNRHGEANDIPYLGLEVRQDLIGNDAAVAGWAAALAPIIAACVTGLAAPL